MATTNEERHMRNLILAAALALLLPTAADAGSNLGFKLGLAFPGGDKWDGYPMATDMALAIPLEVSANFAVSSQTTVGLYGGYALVQPDSAFADYCDAWGGTCDEHLWRLGVKAEVEFPGQVIAPFVGASFGFEWDVLNESVPNYGNDYRETLRGWELGLELGADAWTGQASKLGAFVGLSVGEYNWYSRDGYINFIDDSGSGRFSNRSMHSWFTVGLRGSFGM